jgi:spermidine/putrescine transport system substrate-binding protein
MKFFVYIFVICGTLASCTASCDRSESELDTRERKINFFVWGEYTSRVIFEDFTAQTGISVVESNFASNEELLAKIQAGADGYDLIIPSDYMVTVMTQLDLLAPLDLAAIPNAKNLDPELMGQPHDPSNKWSLPYSWALTGIVYNQEKVTPAISSYRELYTREDIKHRFSILDDSREAIAGILKSNGYSANTTDSNIIEETKQSLLAVKKRIREFSSAPSSQLEQGDLLAAQIYSNEALRLSAKYPKFKFVIPSDGFTIAIDNMAIPKNSRRKALAQQLMNFLLSPEVNLKFSSELMVAPVVSGLDQKLPEKLKSQETMRSLTKIITKAETIRDIGEATKKYDRIWTEVKAQGF